MVSINIRVDDALKEESKAVFENLGLDLTTGIKIYLKQVVSKQGIPFELTTQSSMIEQALNDVKTGNVKKFDSVTALMADLND